MNMKQRQKRHALRTLFLFLSVFFFFLSSLSLCLLQGYNAFTDRYFGQGNTQAALFDSLFRDRVDALSVSFRDYFDSPTKQALSSPESLDPNVTCFSFEARDSEGQVIMSTYDAEKHHILYSKTLTTSVQCVTTNNGTKFREETVTVDCFLRSPYDEDSPDLVVGDPFSRAIILMSLPVKRTVRTLSAVCIGSISLSAVLLVLGCWFTLHRFKKSRTNPKFLETVSPDLFFIFTLPATTFFIRYLFKGERMIALFEDFVHTGVTVYRFLYMPLCITGISVIALVLLLQLLLTMRQGGLRDFSAFKRFESMPFTRKTLLYLLVLQLLKTLSIALFLTAHMKVITIFLIVEKLVTLPILYRCLREIREITEKTQLCADGDLSKPIADEKYYASFRQHADNIQSIVDRISDSAKEYVQSSNFKAELITNLSHDIKTPLTSIISYAQLLRSDSLTDEQRAQYLDVLNRHSGRLTKLLEDLTEVSDAASGNIEAHPEPLDLCSIIRQAAEGFSERLQKRGNSIVYHLPDHPVPVLADARLLWRVVDNMMNNICKYSKPDTEVEIFICKDEETSTVTFENISAGKLDIEGAALLERFVRADSARNSEGFGLGLSIAKTLTLLQNGELSLDIRDDIFSACVRLQNAE